MNDKTRSGFVAIIGRPNVGKSTLLNRILGRKISITSKKPQTTRHQILGIKTEGNDQIIYVDTPGMHIGEKREMNKMMNRAARAALVDVNVVIFVINALQWVDEDASILRLLENVKAPVILLINKIDKLDNRNALLPFIEEISKKYDFHTIIPAAAIAGEQVENLEATIKESLPEDVHYYPRDQVTNRTDQFITAEFVREKLMRFLGDELPYATTVTLDAYEDEPEIVRIAAVIWVEKKSQKSIVIGKDGSRLKEIGTRARQDLESYFDKKVFIKLWVKVKEGWSDSAQSLKTFGYDE